MSVKLREVRHGDGADVYVLQSPPPPYTPNTSTPAPSVLQLREVRYSDGADVYVLQSPPPPYTSTVKYVIVMEPMFYNLPHPHTPLITSTPAVLQLREVRYGDRADVYVLQYPTPPYTPNTPTPAPSVLQLREVCDSDGADVHVLHVPPRTAHISVHVDRGHDLLRANRLRREGYRSHILTLVTIYYYIYYIYRYIRTYIIIIIIMFIY